jgi:ribosomal-protein-alanine N-acetyltransferase
LKGIEEGVVLEKLQTKNLMIRPFELADAADVFLLSQEPGMKKWIPDQVYQDEKEAKEVLGFLISQYKDEFKPDEAPIVYSIVLKSINKVIGHVGLGPYSDHCEVGYAIAEKYWGNGYASEAVIAYSKWFIHQSRIKKIYGVVASENIGSAKVLEKSGYTFEKEDEQMYLGEIRLCRRYYYDRACRSFKSPNKF